MDRQTDRPTDRQTDRQTNRQRWFIGLSVGWGSNTANWAKVLVPFVRKNDKIEFIMKKKTILDTELKDRK